MAVRRALLLAPMEDSSAVVQEPIFCPIIIGTALPKVMAPVPLRAWRTPTLALELCMTVVSRAPARTPKMGLDRWAKSWRNQASCSRGAMALDILSMPIIRRPKPIRIVPTPFFRSDLQKVYKTIPRKARMGLKFAGFSISISNPVPCTPSRLRIHAVTVVPTLEPKITPMAAAAS